MDAIDQLLTRARRSRTLPPPTMRRALRERWKLSQTDVAKVLDVTYPTISRWESGSREPRGAARERYQAFLEKLLEERL